MGWLHSFPLCYNSNCPFSHDAVPQDSDLSRNMPGKVKVSAPNLLAAKKK